MRKGSLRRYPRKEKDLPVGVYRHGHKFKAQIGRNSSIYYLGLFETLEEAVAAVEEAAREMPRLCETRKLPTGVVMRPRAYKSKRFRAQITINRQHVWLGDYATVDEARAAYEKACAEIESKG